MRFRFIEDRRADHPVGILCDVLEVSPAGYSAWHRARRAGARPPIDNSSATSSGSIATPMERYGSPRLHVELRARGRGVSRGPIERLMRRHGAATVGAHD